MVPDDLNPAEPPSSRAIRHLAIKFTGTGSEYFRIWIVNLLLLMLTLGFYWPWAKVRRLRYFWGNTLIDGDPLAFHGEAGQMFKGWLLVGVFFLLYNWASNFSPVAGLVAFVALAALWPALWRSSMRFRMANTSWRGLRMRFVGSTRDAYVALLPSFLFALPLLVVALWLPGEEEPAAPAWVPWSLAASLALVVLTTPWVFWRLKSYQHQHLVIGPLQTDFRVGVRQFYLLAFKPLVLVLFVAALLTAAMMLAGGLSLDKPSMSRWIPLLPLFVLLFYLVFFLGLGPWWTTRFQNLVWTKTGNGRMRFISRLGFRSMLWLSIKNAVLLALTLGLYWPFAKVAMARLRLEAVHIRSVIDLGELLAAESEQPQEAAGEAAGDFFGLDVGL